MLKNLLARTFFENEMLMKAEKKYGVVTQMGNQGHSEANISNLRLGQKQGLSRM
jgi:hypothetical protein